MDLYTYWLMEKAAKEKKQESFVKKTKSKLVGVMRNGLSDFFPQVKKNFSWIGMTDDELTDLKRYSSDRLIESLQRQRDSYN